MTLSHRDPLSGDLVSTYHSVEATTLKKAEKARDELILRLERYESGVYYVPSETLAGRSALNPVKVIRRKYLGSDEDPCGYWAGATLDNGIGLSEQVPARYEVVTNNTGTAQRTVKVGGFLECVVRRAKLPVDAGNVRAQQVLDVLTRRSPSELTESQAEALGAFAAPCPPRSSTACQWRGRKRRRGACWKERSAVYLHDDPSTFEAAVARTANEMRLDPAIVAKDYFVYVALREITARYPDAVFKGGTSLSKCHKAISRFSEDVDLGVEAERLSQGEHRKVKAAVTRAMEALGLAIPNIGETRSRRDYNNRVAEVAVLMVAVSSATTTRTTPASSTVPCSARGCAGARRSGPTYKWTSCAG